MLEARNPQWPRERPCDDRHPEWPRERPSDDRHPEWPRERPYRRAELVETIAARILARNPIAQEFFERQALPLARACREMAQRFTRGGRLLAIGRGPYATDAQHVSVEFVHPVIVGKRALPALDLSMGYESWTQALAREEDVVVAFGPPAGDPQLQPVLAQARRRGCMTMALPGAPDAASYAVASPTDDAHVHQELFELLGHTMYESVHVFLEHRTHADGGGAAGFLYPFLGGGEQTLDDVVPDVADSIRAKARDAAALREIVAATCADAIASASTEIAARLERGATILAFGNGGSATDATDFALDCVAPEHGRPVRAISLALEPAVITATANDVGTDLIFVRQLIAQSKPGDVAIAFSTSGGSRNVVAALEEARRRDMFTVALLGYDGGEVVARQLADVAIVVNCDYIPRIQEAQGTIYHVLREML